jgi:hypothetical protein
MCWRTPDKCATATLPFLLLLLLTFCYIDCLIHNARCRVQDCLNIGVSPKSLIASLRRRFEACGGIIYEQTAFKSAVICPDGVVATLINAADTPVDVGDTNRPNALTKQQQQQQQQQVKGSADGSSSSSTAAGSDAAAAGAAGRRRAPSKLSCRLLVDCMGESAAVSGS